LQDKLLQALKQDYRSANLSAADIKMLDYAVKLTHTPNAINPKDIQSLRSAGWDDRAIHDICSIIAYYAFVNRIADGLGVELEVPNK
jgi:uncharacterized peroxidase-related enzyme